MRNLRKDEELLMKCLLQKTELAAINLDELFIEEMNDGGMGSLYFVSSSKIREKRKMGKQISEIQFTDSDNIPILVTLNLDQDGDLYELDMWKIDFKPIIKFPEC